MPIDFPGFAYAAAVAAGGIFGYYKAGKYILKVMFTNNSLSITCINRDL